MKLNLKKTKLMLFNPSNTRDFQPQIEIDNTLIDVVEESKLLGIHITQDLKWQKHIDNITKRAFSRIWIVKRLSELGA